MKSRKKTIARCKTRIRQVSLYTRTHQNQPELKYSREISESKLFQLLLSDSLFKWGCILQDDILSLWNRTASDQATTIRIRDTLKRVLHLPSNTVMEYKTHTDSLKYVLLKVTSVYFSWQLSFGPFLSFWEYGSMKRKYSNLLYLVKD